MQALAGIVIVTDFDPPGESVPLDGVKDTPLRSVPADQFRSPCELASSDSVTLHVHTLLPLSNGQAFVSVLSKLVRLTANTGGGDGCGGCVGVSGGCVDSVTVIVTVTFRFPPLDEMLTAATWTPGLSDEVSTVMLILAEPAGSTVPLVLSNVNQEEPSVWAVQLSGCPPQLPNVTGADALCPSGICPKSLLETWQSCAAGAGGDCGGIIFLHCQFTVTLFVPSPA